MGNSVLSNNEIYQKIVPFCRRWKKKVAIIGNSCMLYFVSVDIERAFDSLNQAKLNTVVDNVVKEVRDQS